MGIPVARAELVQRFVAQVRGRLIVSCQALEGEPLHGAGIMARVAVAAAQGGAAAIRANSPEDIAAIRAAVDLPIIGLYKQDMPGYPVYITPTLAHAQAVATAGADVIAVDATARPRPEPGNLADYIARIHAMTGLPVLADIATAAEAEAAVAAGADLVSTTMSGYTDDSPQQRGPDLALVGEVVRRVNVPVLAEGRYRTAAQAVEALAQGATAVVVGGAITRPQEITRHFIEEMEEEASRGPRRASL